MKSKKKSLPFITLNIIMIVLFFCIAYKLYKTNYGNSIYCDMNFVVSNYGMTIPVIGTLSLSEGKGRIYLDGPVYQDGNKIGFLSKEVLFSSIRDKNTVIFTGVKIYTPNKNNISQNVAEKVLPDFFVRQNSRISFKIAKENDGYFFFKDGVPFFYCKDSK